MTEEQKQVVALYDKQIKELENEYFQKKENQGAITGTQADVYQKVGENLMAENDFHRKKMELEYQRDEIIGVSAGVEAFLNNKPTLSKFDVDSKAVKIDNSLNPFSGKQI